MNRKWILCGGLAMAVCASALAAGYGVGGAGNNGTSVIEFDFIKSTGITILKSVEPNDLQSIPGIQDAISLYRSCRQTMYLGALRTTFDLVDELPVDTIYHALARRQPGYVMQVSRGEMERLMKNGGFSTSLLTALFLHEAGHDCVMNGEPVDGKFDPVLNQLGTALVSAYDQRSLINYLDIDFISKVHDGTSVRFEDLSTSASGQIARKYLDYIGDWAYQRNRDLFKDRPAPADDFLASAPTSVYPGWGTLDLDRLAVPASLKYLVDNVLRSSFQTGRITYFNGTRDASLPTAMSCSYVESLESGVAGSLCTLMVSWAPLSDPMLSSEHVKIGFTLNLMGETRITGVEVSP